MLTIHFAAIRQRIKGRGIWWSVRFFFVYLGNPVVFFLFSLFTANVLAFNPWFYTKKIALSTTVTWVNPIAYIIATLPLYMAWIAASIGISSTLEMSRCIEGNFDSEKFFAWYVSPGAIVASLPGLLNLFIWCTSGMHGILWGLCVGPMLILAVVHSIMWILAFLSSFTKQDLEDGEYYELQNELV